MAISGWFVLLVAAGVIPVVVFADATALIVWLAVVTLLAVLDLVLAGSPRAVTMSRVLPGRVRLGEPVRSVLTITNGGRRGIRGIVRDGWPPSAGAAPTRARVSIPARERRSITTALTPFRRGDRIAAHVTIRSFGPLGLVARQATIASTDVLRVLPPFTSRKHLPSRLARLRELDGSTSVQ